ncbi:unnamed protein product, partial [Owenia fusiformis]
MALQDTQEQGRRCTQCKELVRGHKGPIGPKCSNLDVKAEAELPRPEPVSTADTKQDIPGWQLAMMEVSQQISGLVAVTKDLQVEQNNMREQVVHITKELGEIKIQTQRQATPIEQRSTAVDQTSAGEQNSIPDTATGTHDTTNVFNVPIPEKVIRTIKNGEFVQMIDILPANLLHDHHENPDPILSLENGQLRQKQTRKIKIIENFSQWLSAWNIFEAIIVQNAPHTYPGLCTYRNIIQEADAKFKWNAVNASDVKYRSKLSQTKSQQFGNIDTQLYVTTFDSTAVK